MSINKEVLGKIIVKSYDVPKNVESQAFIAIENKTGKERFAPIVTDPGRSIIMIKLQDGPVGEVGMNGCQVEDCITFFKKVIEGFNSKSPNHHNDNAISKLNQAINCLSEGRGN